MAEQHDLPPFRRDPMTDGLNRMLSNERDPLLIHETNPNH